jgi:hypothetical protein
MTPEELRTIALGLPEAHSAPHFERESFRVGTKIFATMTEDGTEAMVRVAPQERVEELLFHQPSVFFSYGKWTLGLGAVGVKLAKVDPKLMTELVVASWKRIAPKKIAAAYEASAPKTAAAKQRPASRPAKKKTAKKKTAKKAIKRASKKRRA